MTETYAISSAPQSIRSYLLRADDHERVGGKDGKVDKREAENALWMVCSESPADACQQAVADVNRTYGYNFNIDIFTREVEEKEKREKAAEQTYEAWRIAIGVPVVGFSLNDYTRYQEVESADGQTAWQYDSKPAKLLATVNIGAVYKPSNDTVLELNLEPMNFFRSVLLESDLQFKYAIWRSIVKEGRFNAYDSLRVNLGLGPSALVSLWREEERRYSNYDEPGKVFIERSAFRRNRAMVGGIASLEFELYESASLGAAYALMTTNVMFLQFYLRFYLPHNPNLPDPGPCVPGACYTPGHWY